MDIAIVTGAETPLGLRIVETLIRQGCRVHGIGNNFSNVTYADPQFRAHPVDLTDLDATASTVSAILEEEKQLHILIHAIDVTPGAAFEKLSTGNLEAILKIGLLGPVMMTRLALPNLLRFRGQLINVITGNKHGHAPSAANALIEGGLREMNSALFDQCRDAGLRVTNCLLRQNTGLSGAKVGDDAVAQAHLDFEDAARTIEQLIDPKAVNVPGEITLHPRLSAAAEEALPDTHLPVDPYSAVVLPPKEYRPPEQPKIPTEDKQQIERTIPYTDEEMEEKIAAAIEDFEAHPERYDEKPKQPPAAENRQQSNQPRHEGGQDGAGKSKRRRRRRGGRNRNRQGQDGGTSKPEGAANSQQENAPKQSEPNQPDRQRSEKKQQGKKPSRGAKQSEGPPKESKRPKPEKNESSGDLKPVNKAAKKKAAKKKAAKKAAKSAGAPVAEKKPTARKKLSSKDPAVKKPVKKKAAKKRAKKAVEKKE